MSRVSDQIVRSVADTRRRGFEQRPELPAGALDFDDPVDRVAAFLHRLDFAPEAIVAGMCETPDGQVELAETWAAEPPSMRQRFRLRAAALLDVGTRSRELRERPEENVA